MGLDRDDNLPLAFATWVYLLHVAGIDPDEPELKDRCDDVSAATEPEAGNAAGEGLVARVRALIGDDGAPAHVLTVARRLYGERIKDDLGIGDREERTARIRKYQFGRSLPWLARIWEKRDGGVHPSWLLVEQVTDQVVAMDPNPWNDVDEERHLPVHDFHVLWELDDCSNVHVA